MRTIMRGSRCASALKPAGLRHARCLSSGILAENKLSVLQSSPEFLAINKPAGVPFHSTDDALGVIPTIRSMEASGLLTPQGKLYPLHRCATFHHAQVQASGEGFL